MDNLNTTYCSPSEHRKRVAVFGGGWGGEYLSQVLAGIIENSHKENLDIFTFINFSFNAGTPAANFPEVEFFKMPPLEDFDGVILLANSFNQKEEFDYLTGKIKELNLPAVSVEYELDGVPSIISDNYAGMYSLSEHIINEHGAKNIVFVSGPVDHPENVIRHKALKDAMKNNGLTLTNDNILFGNWGKDTIPALVNGWMAAHDNKFPDAFVCANDIMAIAVCEQVRSLGYDVPADVSVTGYDCLGQSQNYMPPVTTVNHEWYAMGQKTIDTIVDLLNNKEVPEVYSLATKLVVGGTCGCTGMRMYNKSKQYLSKALTDVPLDPMVTDSHFRHFITSVRKISEIQNLHYSLAYLFEHEHQIEGNNFGLYLYSEFFEEDAEAYASFMPSESDSLEMVVSLENGVSVPLSQVGLKEALFKKADSSPTPVYHLFIPLHSAQKIYGFAALDGPLNVATENQFYIWAMHMTQTLEQLESNITIDALYRKMELLSVTDPLTQVYNRSGCEKISYPMLVDWGRQDGESILILVDVDKMKLINDQYGHSSGDIALKIVASSLKNSLPEDFIISRFGGDEFFVAGKLLDSQSINPDRLVSRVEQAIEKEVSERELPFTVSASMGYTIASPKTISDIEHAVVQADLDMYKNKQIHHANN